MSVYCNNCGTEITTNANFCSCCGNALNKNAGYTENVNGQSTSGMSDTAKTVATVAGVAVGASLLGCMFRR